MSDCLPPSLPAAIEKLTLRLQSYLPRRLEVEHSGRAAVLIPILERRGEFCFLLTQRTHKVETHKGQISFPGGIQEDWTETFLRQPCEKPGRKLGWLAKPYRF